MSAKSRTTETYEQLKRDLLDARYLPGAKLKIDQIAEELAVSPTAVREALSRLTSEGLVRALPQRGFQVAPVSADDLVDLTSVRIDIETRCLRRAIQIGDVAWEGRVLSSLHQLRRTHHLAVVDGHEVMNPEWTRVHAEFHGSLIAACDSHWWLRLREQMFLQAERYRRLLVPYTRGERNVDAEHEELAEATLARAADRASRLLADHLRRTADLLLASEVPFEDMPDWQARARAS